ncbi:phosphoadenylyl-sulfate reductase [Rhodovulum sp. DZ06]|uniref:phosphoadenylyl-sulfate reductase n=1 Tax=Rhodovulum sp. DZ06 TaxID=3425126 RepID=UPI003D35996C
MTLAATSPTAAPLGAKAPSRPMRSSEDAQRLADRLNAEYAGASAEEILRAAFVDKVAGDAALVSSFGADSAALLHLLAQVAPDAPVLLLDTQMLFPETLAYQQELSAKVGLTGVRRIRPDEAARLAEDPADDLHQRDHDACCDLRKVRPLENALAPFGAAVTGRKRHQAATRADMKPFEIDGAGRLRINPLADWSSQDVRAYIKDNALPPHPLVAKGYPSIGCAPCTTPVKPGEDPRAGRWRGADKEECGIHIVDGKVVRPARAA